MSYLTDTIPISIPTQRGEIDISQILPGDQVYDYIKGEFVEVQGIEGLPKDDTYQIVYSDGRKEIYHHDEDVCFAIREKGNGICFISGHQIYTGCIPPNFKPTTYLKQFPIEFNKGKVVNPLVPDPYMAGALIMNGDYRDNYINLPIDRNGAKELFSKRGLAFGDRLGNNKVYFSYEGASSKDLITWNEFFPNSKFFGKDKGNSPIIPHEYFFSSIRDRWQFVRGAFDVGFSELMFPESCCIAHKSEFILLGLQELLWSLGVISTVIYDPTTPYSHEKKYRLEIQEHYDNYPGFFYYTKHIETMIRNRIKFEHRIPEFKLKIDRIHEHHRMHGYKLIFKEPHVIYLTGNFLPRVGR